MIDLMTIVAFNTRTRQGLSNALSKLHQRIEILEHEILPVIVDEEKPVAAPRNITRHWSKSGHVNSNFCREPVARHVCHFNFATLVEMRDHDADGSLDAMCAGTDAIQVCEGRNEADGPMSAHAEITDAVEEDHSGGARCINRRAQQGSDDSFETARFIHHCVAKVVMLPAKALDAIDERVVAEIRRSTDNHARGLTTGV